MKWRCGWPSSIQTPCVGFSRMETSSTAQPERSNSHETSVNLMDKPSTHLDARWAPGYEVCQFPFTDALQGLVNLSGVNIALDDVQNGDVTTLTHGCGHHDVFRLQQPPHDVQHGGALHCTGLEHQQAKDNARNHEHDQARDSGLPCAPPSTACSLS